MTACLWDQFEPRDLLRLLKRHYPQLTDEAIYDLQLQEVHDLLDAVADADRPSRAP